MLGEPWGKVGKGQNSSGSSKNLTGQGNSTGQEGALRGIGREGWRGTGPCGLSQKVEISPQDNSPALRGLGQGQDRRRGVLDIWLVRRKEDSWV